MVKLIEQWGKPVAENNVYVVQSTNDLDDIEDIKFGDKAYVIDTGAHKIHDTDGWQNYFTPKAYVVPAPPS